MKMFRIVFCALLAAMALTACQHDAPNAAGAPTEEYMRAFIKEFGVPAEGHTFSMARSAGLQVKASRPTHITVTAVVDDEEYLFADLSVPAGVTPIPVTIPSQVNTVNLTVYGYKYAVAADGIADLDNLPEPLSDPKSRTIEFPGGWQERDPSDYPVLIFKPSDFLQEYFEEYPIGENIPEYRYQFPGDIEGHTTTGPMPYCSTALTTYYDQKGDNYLIFPIYFSPDKKLESLKFYLESYGKFGLEQPNNTLAETNVNSIGQLTSYNFPDYETTSYYDPNSDRIILSKGHRINWDYNAGRTFSLLMEYWHAGKHYYNSSDCQFNIKYYYNYGEHNYFSVDIDHLPLCMGGTRRYYLKSNKFQVYMDGKVQDISGFTPFLLCFNQAPVKPNDCETIRDYADAIYLIIPIGQLKIMSTKGGVRKYPSYKWMVLAEDLGGSFDWDFNDAVFEFTDVVESILTENAHIKEFGHYWDCPTDATPVRKISVTPLAAGGTMPLYITYTGKVSVVPELPSSGPEDYYTVNEAIRRSLNAPKEGTWVIGTEIHKWMGASTHTKQLNTGNRVELAPGETISFAIPTDATPSDNRFTMVSSYNQAMSSLNQPLAGFAVLVDKENTLNIDARAEGGVYELPTHSLGQGTYLIGKPDEDKDNVAPQMILVSGSSSDPFEWPRECVSMKDAYVSFPYWISGVEPVFGNPKDMSKVTCRGENHEGQHPY